MTTEEKSNIGGDGVGNSVPQGRFRNHRGRGARGAHRRRGGGSRRGRASGVVGRSIADGIAQIQGAIDAEREAVAEDQEEKDWAEYRQEFNPNNNWPVLEALIDKNDPKGPHPPGSGGGPEVPSGGGNDPPPHAPNVSPVTPIKGVSVHKATVPLDVKDGLTFEDLVTAHFVAFEYSEKSLTSALGNILRWKMVSKDRDTIVNNVKTVHSIFASRQLRLSWHHRVSGLIRDYIHSINPITMLGRTVTVGITLAKLYPYVAGRTIPFTNITMPKVSVLKIGVLGVGVSIVTTMVAWWKLRKPEFHVTNQPILPTYCTGAKLQPGVHQIDAGAKLRFKAGRDQFYKCEPSAVKIGFTFGRKYVWCPRNCVHNEVNALVTRQLQPKIPVTNKGNAALKLGQKELHKSIPTVNIDVPKSEWLDLFLDKYPAHRREVIRAELARNAFIDADVKGFPKIEIMTGKKCADRKVRFISGFSDGYLAETGPEYYLWQKAMCKELWSVALVRDNQKFVYTGGLLGDEVGAWFSRVVALGWTVLLLDFSKFDSRNKTQILQRLYSFYRRHLSKQLYDFLMQSFDKKGSTSHGLLFYVIATVASGRIDTSFGNTLIVFMLACAILYLLDPKYLDAYLVSALGDDNNIAIPEFRHTMEDINKASRELGHDADGLIITPDKYHLMEYCSQRLWEYQPGEYVLGPKPGRLLAKTFITHKHVPDSKMEAHITGVMEGFKNYSWIPVFNFVYDTWMKRHPMPGKLFYKESEYRIQLKKELVIDESLISEQFFKIYGFYAEQLAGICDLEFNIGDCYEHPLIERMLEADGVKYDYDMADHIQYYKECSQTLISTTKTPDLHIPSCFH